MAKKRLFALLCAIDNYPIAHHRLNGCVNDRNEVVRYLEETAAGQDVELIIETLTDEQVTRSRLIDAFTALFNQAQPQDTCVFYFSGHGSQAPAPSAFWHLAASQMMESILCYDSRLPGGRDLTDKEIGHMIWEVTDKRQVQPHFLALFDCCHSGNMTRASETKARMAETSDQLHALEDYYGIEGYRSSEVNGHLALTPQAGTFVQLGACAPDQTAKEQPIMGVTRGVFTYNLINTLKQTGGAVRYQDLINSLSVRLANRVRDQRPVLEATRPQDKQLAFLGGVIPSEPPYFMVDRLDGKWGINGGEIQGVASRGILELKDGTELRIDEVGLNRSTVSGMSGKSDGQSYKAYVKLMDIPMLRVAYAPDIDAAAKKLLDKAIPKATAPGISIVASDSDPAYWIRSTDETFRLTLPDDERPVFRRIEGWDANNADIFVSDLEKVAKWDEVRQLTHPAAPDDPLKLKIELLEVTEVGNLEDDAPTQSVDYAGDGAVFHYQKDSKGEWKSPAYQVKITNESDDKTIYVSAINLMDNFKISNKMMAREAIPPRGVAWLYDRPSSGGKYLTIPVGVNKSYASWGVDQKTEYLKFVITDDEALNTDFYNQTELEFDFRKADGIMRSGREEMQDELPPKKSWKTVDMPITVVRPLESVNLSAGTSATLVGGLTIEAPEDVSAQVRLISSQEAQRAIGATASPNPVKLWGVQNLGEPLELTRGLGSAPGLSVVELAAVKNADKVDIDNPLRFKVNTTLQEDEHIFPMGYDEETGLYYPLGVSFADGEIRVETLPEPTSSNDRSVSGSIKIFLQKVVLSKLGFTYKHPQIAWAQFEESGEAYTQELDLGKIKAALEEANSVVIFMHGIIGDTEDMVKAARRVKQADGTSLLDTVDMVLAFDYENLKTRISETATELKKRLETDLGLTADHGKQITIIAHSMGGLVSRWYIEKEGGNAIISKLIQVGTPNLGSPWSDVYQLASTLLSRAVNGAVFLKPYIIPLSILGRFAGQLFVTLEDMDPDNSEILKKLNDKSDPGIPYTIIAGNTKLIPVSYEERQEKLLKKIFRRFKDHLVQKGHYIALDKLLFKDVPNDIAVSVTSILDIPGKADRAHPPVEIEVAADHISYFADPAGLDGLAAAVFE